MDKFRVGDTAKVFKGKYKGRTVEIVRVNQNPFIYECRVPEGIELALYENELETMWEHDMRLLKMWKGIVNQE